MHFPQSQSLYQYVISNELLTKLFLDLLPDLLEWILDQAKLKKVSGPPAWSIFCVVKLERQTDNYKRHYDRKYIHFQTVMLLNMLKNLENMHNKSHKLYSRIDAETQF